MSIAENLKLCIFAALKFRDVAQSGLEYPSGGRGVGSSNLLIPTIDYQRISRDVNPFLFYYHAVTIPLNIKPIVLLPFLWKYSEIHICSST